MSIQGELTISLTRQTGVFHSEILSSRPLYAAQLFSGKTIEHTLQTLPLLFNICAKAQAVTAVRAVESAIGYPIDNQIESQREALVTIESLREHSLQILMDWPDHINESLNNEALSECVQALNKLIQLFEPQYVLCVGAKMVENTSPEQGELWNECEEVLSKAIFGLPIEQWQQDSHTSIVKWSKQQETQAARFIHWLNQQDWKYAGSSNVELLPEINDSELVTRLTAEQENFTAQPDWQTRCYEASWFNHQQYNPVIKQLQQDVGKGIYTRVVARLIEIADLMKRLQQFFRSEITLNRPVSTVNGLAHTDAARGRLSHYVQLEDDIVKRLFILAPTEWNFHPQGIAVESLNNLECDDLSTLQLQADLLIHAIDPCVGYQLQINSGVMH